MPRANQAEPRLRLRRVFAIFGGLGRVPSAAATFARFRQCDGFLNFQLFNIVFKIDFFVVLVGFNIDGVEVIFMWCAEPWRRRVGPAWLVVIGGVGSMVRWTALAFSPPLWALFPLQALHAASFTATFLGGLRLIERLSPPTSASAAQSLNSSVANGVLTGLATVAAGPLFDAFGARGYLSMTAMALVGTIGAVWLVRPARGGATSVAVER